MKLEAGGKPWRRKPSEAPAVTAASTPAELRSRDRAMTVSAAAEIRQTPAASPSTPSIRLITLATATIPKTVSTWPRSMAPMPGGSKSWTEPGSTRPRKGSVKLSTVTPEATGMIAAAICPSSLRPAGRSTRSSMTPTAVITIAPARIALVSWSHGRKIVPPIRTAARTAIPPSFGVGTSCRLRSLGTSIAPIPRASDSVAGTSAQTAAPAKTNPRRASSVSGIRPSRAPRLSQPAPARSDRTRG